MKIIGLTFVISLILLLNCSSIDFSNYRETEFKSNLDKDMFLSSAIDVLKEYKFQIASQRNKNENLIARFDYNNDFAITFTISFDEESRNVKIITMNEIKKSGNIQKEYYDLDNFNSEYKEYFYDALFSIKVNAVKTAFPNR